MNTSPHPARRQRRTRILLIAFAVASLAAAPGGTKSGRTTALTPDSVPAWGTSCSPPTASTTMPYRCYPQAWGSPGRLGVDIVVGSGLAGPFPIGVEATAFLANGASHELTKARDGVTYTWEFQVGHVGSWNDAHVVNSGHPPARSYIVIDIVASHDACASCTGSARHMLVGDDGTGASVSSRVPVGTTFSVPITLANVTGQWVPPGTVTVVATLRAVAEWEGPFEGHSLLHAPLTVTSIVAR